MTGPACYRVAVVAACPFPSLRGSQVLIRELAEHLAAAGHVVHVVTYPAAQHLVPVRRIAIHRVANVPGLATVEPLGWRKLVLDLLLAVLLYRVIRRERIQIVHAHNVEGPLVAWAIRCLTGVPVVYHAHNAPSDELPCYARSPWARRLMAWAGALLDALLVRISDRAIALSDRLGAFLAARGAAGRVAVIPPGVSVPSGAARPLRRSGRPVIAYAGNLDPYQDLPLLLAAFARVRRERPAARLVLITHGAAPRAAAQMAARLRGSDGVSVLVVATFAAALRHLAAADLVVCPRGSWSGFPIKVLNYMRLGLPIVQARGSAYSVTDGVSGVLFDDGDPGSLAHAMLTLADDRNLAARVAAQARRIAREQYGWPQVIERVLAVYAAAGLRSEDAGPRAAPAAAVWSARRHARGLADEGQGQKIERSR
jgi:glycosyltransferase involved in cell wall biosynthesis